MRSRIARCSCRSLSPRAILSGVKCAVCEEGFYFSKFADACQICRALDRALAVTALILGSVIILLLLVSVWLERNNVAISDAVHLLWDMGKFKIMWPAFQAR